MFIIIIIFMVYVPVWMYECECVFVSVYVGGCDLSVKVRRQPSAVNSLFP